MLVMFNFEVWMYQDHLLTKREWAFQAENWRVERHRSMEPRDVLGELQSSIIGVCHLNDLIRLPNKNWAGSDAHL